MCLFKWIRFLTQLWDILVSVQLVLEGVRARQTGDALLMEKRMMEKTVQQTKKTIDFYEFKAGRLEDQVIWEAHLVFNALFSKTNHPSAAVKILHGAQAESRWRESP